MRARILVVAVAVVAGLALLPAVVAQAASPTLKVSPAAGPPTATVKAKGSHFPAGDDVSVTFDGTAVASATVAAAGTFSAPFTVPATTLPGAHAVAAFDARGLGASTTFIVEADWGSARYDAEGSGFNPYENLLSGPAGPLPRDPAGIGGMGLMPKISRFASATYRRAR